MLGINGVAENIGFHSVRFALKGVMSNYGSAGTIEPVTGGVRDYKTPMVSSGYSADTANNSATSRCDG